MLEQSLHKSYDALPGCFQSSGSSQVACEGLQNMKPREFEVEVAHWMKRASLELGDLLIATFGLAPCEQHTSQDTGHLGCFRADQDGGQLPAPDFDLMPCNCHYLGISLLEASCSLTAALIEADAPLKHMLG